MDGLFLDASDFEEGERVLVHKTESEESAVGEEVLEPRLHLRGMHHASVATAFDNLYPMGSVDGLEKADFRFPLPLPLDADSEAGAEELKMGVRREVGEKGRRKTGMRHGGFVFCHLATFRVRGGGIAFPFDASNSTIEAACFADCFAGNRGASRNPPDIFREG